MLWTSSKKELAIRLLFFLIARIMRLKKNCPAKLEKLALFYLAIAA